ncbi:MAG: TerC/Alx family metal homeostasis membrane protein [Archangium sp.]|nr:TerC/Alx family metal homeostasis membrane protein [Archangium sp.]
MGTPALWVGFLLGVVAVVAIDLNLSAGKPVSARTAAIWTGVWVSLSLGFAAFLYTLGGTTAALPFLTAYIIEYALSVDNLFVFIIIFSFFKVPTAAQHRLLYWGIVGAFILRGALIAAGTTLVQRFEWILYIFGAFLLYTAWKLLSSSGTDDEVDPANNPMLKLARRVLPVAEGDHGLHFMVKQDGRRKVTTLFLVLLVVETSDLLFALDSIPAVLSISQDPFIVFSSNACAILGLRSLFFVVNSLMDKFRYLKIGLGLILGFVGIKLCLETAFAEYAHGHEAIVISVSLGFIALTLAGSIIASILIKPKPEASPAEHV